MALEKCENAAIIKKHINIIFVWKFWIQFNKKLNGSENITRLNLELELNRKLEQIFLKGNFVITCTGDIKKSFSFFLNLQTTKDQG